MSQKVLKLIYLVMLSIYMPLAFFNPHTMYGKKIIKSKKKKLKRKKRPGKTGRHISFFSAMHESPKSNQESQEKKSDNTSSDLENKKNELQNIENYQPQLTKDLKDEISNEKAYKIINLLYKLHVSTNNDDLTALMENLAVDSQSYKEIQSIKKYIKKAFREASQEQNNFFNTCCENIKNLYAIAYNYDETKNDELFQNFIIKQFNLYMNDENSAQTCQKSIKKNLAILLSLISMNGETIISEINDNIKLKTFTKTANSNFTKRKEKNQKILDEFNKIFNLELKPPRNWTPYIIAGATALAAVTAIVLGKKYFGKKKIPLLDIPKQKADESPEDNPPIDEAKQDHIDQVKNESETLRNYLKRNPSVKQLNNIEVQKIIDEVNSDLYGIKKLEEEDSSPEDITQQNNIDQAKSEGDILKNYLKRNPSARQFDSSKTLQMIDEVKSDLYGIKKYELLQSQNPEDSQNENKTESSTSEEETSSTSPNEDKTSSQNDMIEEPKKQKEKVETLEEKELQEVIKKRGGNISSKFKNYLDGKLEEREKRILEDYIIKENAKKKPFLTELTDDISDTAKTVFTNMRTLGQEHLERVNKKNSSKEPSEEEKKFLVLKKQYDENPNNKDVESQLQDLSLKIFPEESWNKLRDQKEYLNKVQKGSIEEEYAQQEINSLLQNINSEARNVIEEHIGLK